MKQVYPRLKRSRPFPFPLEDCSFPQSGLSDLATLGLTTVRSWKRKVLSWKRKLGLELFYLRYTCFQPYRTFADSQEWTEIVIFTNVLKSSFYNDILVSQLSFSSEATEKLKSLSEAEWGQSTKLLVLKMAWGFYGSGKRFRSRLGSQLREHLSTHNFHFFLSVFWDKHASGEC